MKFQVFIHEYHCSYIAVHVQGSVFTGKLQSLVISQETFLGLDILMGFDTHFFRTMELQSNT